MVLLFTWKKGTGYYNKSNTVYTVRNADQKVLLRLKEELPELVLVHGMHGYWQTDAGKHLLFSAEPPEEGIECTLCFLRASALFVW